jgi:glycosidase
MRIFLSTAFLLMIAFASNKVNAASITFDQNDATVWLYMQSIAGKISGNMHNIKLHCNNTEYTVKVNRDNTFKIMVKLGNSDNKIWATGTNGGNTITSSQLTLTLGYRLLPDIKPYAVIENGKPTLKMQLINNPTGKALHYLWTTATTNQAVCKIASKQTATTRVTIPNVSGIYYFNLRVTLGTDTARFQTYIVRDGSKLHAYKIGKDHAAWIDTAVIYEINPSVFVKHGTYDAITEKLPEIKSLGVNTIWLQPICQTDDRGQGYSVTDYFAMRTDLGTEEQLKKLISTAKKLHFKVMLDFVPNHTSINHPYAQQVIKYGDSSHYYNFFQHKNDGKSYSSDYIFNANGLVSYFWKNLVNLDYNNPEVQQWMIEAIKYWMLKYDLDGFRFDTMWGVNLRAPSFSKKLNTELKSIKPDLLLLAEEKSCDEIVYQNGFDAAYDWTADTTWVSQWIFQTHYNAKKSITIFNSPNVSQRSELLSKAIFQNSSITNRSLRFIENNDVPRFIASHTLEQTKMAAALNFALPGIPMIYNGQEIGYKGLPYAAHSIFTSTQTIELADTNGLFPFYKKLTRLRLQCPQLTSTSINQVALINSPNMMAFHRWKNNQHIIVIVNLDESPATASLAYDAGLKPYLHGINNLNDLITDSKYQINTNNASTMQIPMQGYGIRYLLVEPKINQ